jgi:hypothetical protein
MAEAMYHRNVGRARCIKTRDRCTQQRYHRANLLPDPARIFRAAHLNFMDFFV